MPRKINPAHISAGPGSTSRANAGKHALTSVPPVGEPGRVDATGTVVSGFPLPHDRVSHVAAALKHHLDDPVGAHEAAAIATDPSKPLTSPHLFGQLAELAGAVAAPPPVVGRVFNYMDLSGIPDWGSLKLNETPDRNPYINPDAPHSSIYPTYWMAPTPSADWEFSPMGQDPASDPVWNNITGSQWGLTPGDAVSAGFTRGGSGPIIQSRSIHITGDVLRFGLSGAVFPADRGVLALVHWPAEGDIQDFLNQPLTDRCWAALLLGQGIDTPCVTSVQGVSVGDGDPGGIFHLGTDADGNYDPFSYPGRAAGQYDLHELHRGLSAVDGAPLPEPWDTPQVKVQNTPTRAAGQVRLGSDPDAGVAPEPYGIPVLGAQIDAYSPNPAADGTLGVPVIGHTAFPTDKEGDRYNFFRYRLPYLKDYSLATGLKYTPRAANAPSFIGDAARYFQAAEPINPDVIGSSVFPTGVDYRLVQAGNYPNFDDDHWTWQLARFRQIFWAPADAKSELGSLWLIHFKRERDFEAFVRDGIMPWDSTHGYSVHSMSLVKPDVGDVGNIVNVDTSRDPGSFGFGSQSYHVLRREIFTTQGSDNSALTVAEWDFDEATSIMWVSGVAYFTPVNATTGAKTFHLADLTVEGTGYWDLGAYGVYDEAGYFGPAYLSSRTPAMLSVAGFAYEGKDFILYGNWDSSAGLTFSVPLGLSMIPRKQRVELPVFAFGFSPSNGPQNGDPLQFSLPPNGTITLQGDKDTPAFIQGVHPVFHFRGVLGEQSHLIPHTSGDQVLFHSTGFNLQGSATPVGCYGNFKDGNGDAYTTLLTAEKDVRERFLDEVYRYQFTTGTAVGDHLVGPGMQDWPYEPISVPVRAGADNGATFNAWSWLRQDHHLTLPAGGLQVRGLYQRNPTQQAGLTEPFPSAGLLQYPTIDYTTGFRPNSADDSVTQPDYSSETGDRSYVRAFDANFSRSAQPIQQEGQPFVFLRIDGLDLEDFAFKAPGFGRLNETGIAILVKIPGLTTWMDLGRPDGDGPSKQDNLLDGAGCQVIGPYTYTYFDHETGLVYSQVQAHVGPAATLFAGVGGECPVLVRVVMRHSGTVVAHYDLGWKKVSTGTFDAGGPDRAYPTHEVRGLLGIRVLRPDDAKPLTEDMVAAKTDMGITVL